MKRYIHSATYKYNGFNASEFDWGQLREIRVGLESGVDISWYADPKFDGEQMKQIRFGLENGLDVSQYANPRFDWKQMAQIRWGLVDGLDVSQYADPKFDWRQMKEISEGLEAGGKSNPAKSTKKQPNWVDREYIKAIASDEEMDALWETYLSGPEGQVNEELQIYPEASIQGGSGSVYIFDESGQDRWGSYDKKIDWNEWCDHELDLVLDSSNAEEYKQKYKAWMKDFLGI